MKKLYYIVFILFFIVGCRSNDPSGYPITSNLNSTNIIVVEGCEYFVVNAYASYTYVHKGNCKNKIHYENRLDSINQ